MRAFLLVGAVALAVTGCSGGSSSPDAAPGVPSVSLDTSIQVPDRPQALPALGYEVIAAQPVPDAVDGIALYGDHAAYVEDEYQLRRMPWRTGRR